MSTDLPTASITGQHGWEWNQRQAQQEPQDAPSSPARRSDDRSRVEPQRRRRGSGGIPHSPPAASHATTDHSRRELAAELERRERRLQHVIDHYEHLLAEKNRQLANQGETTAAARVQQALSSLFESLVR